MKELQLFEGSAFMENFEGEDRYAFPPGLFRVTAGPGGEVIMMVGSEKIAILDTGMAFCAKGVVENIKIMLEKLSAECGKERHLDYILLTHTHYDHVGGLSVIKQAFPNATTCASEYAAYILGRESALKRIENLSRKVALQYTGDDQIIFDHACMKVDLVVHEGDRLLLGDKELAFLETPGHTSCSLTYALEPDRILFLSESVGVLEKPGHVECQAIKSYAEARESIRKCKAYEADHLITPHYGMVPDWYHEEFWKLSAGNLDTKTAFAKERLNSMTEEEILQDYIKFFWTEDRALEQPFSAFCENAVNEVRAAMADAKL